MKKKKNKKNTEKPFFYIGEKEEFINSDVRSKDMRTKKVPTFTIGCQTFSLGTMSGMKFNLRKKMLQNAFKNLETKNKEVFEIHRDFLLELRKDVLNNPSIHSKHNIWISDVNIEINLV